MGDDVPADWRMVAMVHGCRGLIGHTSGLFERWRYRETMKQGQRPRTTRPARALTKTWIATSNRRREALSIQIDGPAHVLTQHSLRVLTFGLRAALPATVDLVINGVLLPGA